MFPKEKPWAGANLPGGALLQRVGLMASLKESGGWQEGGNKMAKVLLGEDSGYRAME
jgi:hypothetical protein